VRKLRLVCALFSVAFTGAATPGSAAGADPSSSFAVVPSCTGAAACLTQAVHVLDEARARLDQPAYALPNNFASLDPAEQAFVLANLDRVAAGLRPLAGVTGELDQAAAVGVRSDSDPLISDQAVLALASDWAGGYRNMPFAYEAWMYDDGPGGANVDCTPANGGGCWAHRHAILSSFAGGGPLAMGAASGADLTGVPGDTVLLVQGSSDYRPSYVYTWSQALADGAGANTAPAPAARTSPRFRPFQIVDLLVRGHVLRFRLVALRRIRFTCVLLRVSADHSSRRRVRPCGAHTRYRKLARGSYWLKVDGAGRTITRHIVVRA
jgi:hypothetical protein